MLVRTLSKKIILLGLTVLFLGAQPAHSSVFAKPQPTKHVKIDKVVEYWDRVVHDEPSRADFKTIRDLLLIGRDKLKISEMTFSLEEAKNSDFSKVGKFQFQRDFNIALERQKSWAKRFSDSEAKVLASRLNEFKPFVEDIPYVWAWLQFQAGKTDDAKKTLETDFNEMYKTFMAETNEYSGLNKGNRLKREEEYYEALCLVIPTKDRPALDKMMKDMKEHAEKVEFHPMPHGTI